MLQHNRKKSALIAGGSSISASLMTKERQKSLVLGKPMNKTLKKV